MTNPGDPRAPEPESGSAGPASAVSGVESPAPTPESIRNFVLRYFPDHARLPFSRFHDYLFLRRAEKLSAPLDSRRGRIDVMLAPRGAAKSTILALIFPIHALVHRYDRYILIVSATLFQARGRLAGIRRALRDSERLRRDFPQIEGRWRTDSADSIVVHDVRIDARSSNVELRGLLHGPWRPTWIILDDAEGDSRVVFRHHRDHMHRWMSEVIDHLGDASTNIDLIGTLLHNDALPKRLALRPDVRYEVFRSIMAEASDQELWTAWRDIVINMEDPGRIEAARRFFEERRERMLEGAEVLWPERESYYDLQLLRVNIGHAAFDKEKQNEPPHIGGGCFDPATFRCFSVENDTVVPRESTLPKRDALPPAFPFRRLRIFGFLDPASGRRNRRDPSREPDYASIVTVGVDTDRKVYVLDAWLERASPSRQILRVFEMHERWSYSVFGVETNSFQSLYLDQLAHEQAMRRERGERSDLSYRGVNNHMTKENRITGLQPLVEDGRLLFSDDLKDLFLEQLEDFPHGTYDDGPDALEGAVTLGLGEVRPPAELRRLQRSAEGGSGRF